MYLPSWSRGSDPLSGGVTVKDEKEGGRPKDIGAHVDFTGTYQSKTNVDGQQA